VGVNIGTSAANINIGGSECAREGLVMWLDAGNESSYPGSGTTWYDLSQRDNHATISGTNPYTDGIFDYPDTDQNTNYISLNADAAQLTSTEYTLEMWLYPHASAARYGMSMSNGSNHNYYLLKQNATTLQRQGGTNDAISYSDREKFQWVIRRDGSDTGKMYKNGAYVTDSTNITVISGVSDGGWFLNQEQDSFAGGFSSTQNFRGGWMIIRLYNRALSQSEILYNWHTNRGRFGI